MSENNTPVTTPAPTTTNTPAPVQSSAERMAAALAEVAAPAATVDTPTTPVVAQETPKSEPQMTTLERVAREKSALRAEQEKMKPFMEAAKTLTPDTIATINKARAAGNPITALQALGFSPQQVIQHLQAASAPKPEAKSEEKTLQLPPEIEAKLAKLDTMEKFMVEQQARTAQDQEKQIMEGVRSSLTDDFRLVKAMGAEAQVMKVIELFHAEHGTLPGEDFTSSVRMAAEEVEKQLSKEADRWKRVLTMSEPQPTVAPEVTGEQTSRGQVVTGKTLTNSNTGAPAPVQQKPQTREERIAALINDPTFQLPF